MYEHKKIERPERHTEVKTTGNVTSIKTVNGVNETLPNLKYVRKLEAQLSELKSYIGTIDEDRKRLRYELHEMKLKVQNLAARVR